MNIKTFKQYEQELWDGEENTPSSVTLTDGRTLIFWERSFGDMAGETNYYWEFMVSTEPVAGQSFWDMWNAKKFEDVDLKDVKHLIEPSDLAEIEQVMAETGRDNEARSRSFVESRLHELHGEMESEEYTLPAYWAGYLINGDATGYSDEEIQEIDDFLAKRSLGFCTGVSDDTWFAHRNDANSMGSDVAKFTFMLDNTTMHEGAKIGRAEIIKKIEKALAYFPDDTNTWAKATDEIRDWARSARETLGLGEDKALNFRAIKTPSEWNTKGKAYIREMIAKMNDAQLEAYYKDDFSTFELTEAGKVPFAKVNRNKFHSQIRKKLKNLKVFEEFEYDDEDLAHMNTVPDTVELVDGRTLTLIELGDGEWRFEVEGKPVSFKDVKRLIPAKDIEWVEETIEESAKNVKSMTDDDLVKYYNSYIRFINSKIDLVLAKEGKLPDSYFKPGVEAKMEEITGRVRTLADIKAMRADIAQNFADLKDGWDGLKSSGRY